MHRRRELAGKPEAGQIRGGGGTAGRCGGRHRPHLRLEKDATRARCFRFGEPALLGCIHGRLDGWWHDWLSTILRAQNGAAQVA